MTLYTRVITVLLLFLANGTAFSADAPRFEVTRYQVEGNTRIPADEVERLLAPHTGKDRDFASVQQAVETLEQAYRSRGFHAVRVVLPEQELRDGAVKLTVVESRIGTVTVEGNRHFSNSNIRASVPQLQEGTLPNIDRISQEIRVANENPAKKMQMILQGGEREDILNASLKITDEKPWKLGLILDDTGTRQTGNQHLSFLGQYANLFNRDHLFTFQYTTSPDHLEEVSIYSLGYRIPLYTWGDSLDLYGGYSDVDSGAVQSGILSLNVSGKGSFAGIRYNQNLVRRGEYEHRLMYGFDYRRFENNVVYSGSQLGSNTEAHLASIGYAGSFAHTGGGTAEIWGSVSQNIPGGSDGDKAAFQRTRVGATDDFTIFRGGSTLLYPLPADWQTRFTINGQYSAVPLIPGEQFGMGGQGSLRGFDERELTDDIGVAGSLEFYTPNLLKKIELTPSLLRALVFYDVGYVKRNQPEPGEKDHRTAASTGLGLRLSISKHLTASTDYAFVVKPEGNRSKGSGRWHFRVQLTF